MAAVSYFVLLYTGSEAMKSKYTAFGFVAIIIWAMSAALTRNLGEKLGAFTSAALVSTIAGCIAIVYQIITNKGFESLKKIPLNYWLICGPLYVIYTTCSYISISLASTREQSMIVVLIKFLWPLLTLLLTIPVLKAKSSPWLFVGIFLSLAGIITANLGRFTSLSSLMASLSANVLSYVLAFTSALAWALYSNLTCKFIGNSDQDSVGFFMLATGIIVGGISLTMHEPRLFTPSIVGTLIYQSIITSVIGTLLWDAAMRRGNVVLVVITSNFLPIITTILTALMLSVAITPPMLIGAVLVVAGTFWSKRCFDAARQKDEKRSLS